ncbi:PROTEIN putative-RELATED [Salix koriyanagi]|uniref:PROTEIN putative-RELATED n=1 Tax=Salix koriyanagi TaxID=2511006 RepID=A0A9Q0VBG4_9ROSI|nr:PROTEIN putative-RELATED [Salix koriyanagi]
MLVSQAHRSRDSYMWRKRIYGGIIDTNSLRMLEERRDLFYLISFIVHNTKPVGHQDLVGLVISMLLLGDFSLVLLTLLQLHGPRRSAGLARIYALWIVISFINVVVAFICGYIHYNSQSSSSMKLPFQTWSISMDESEWWIFPAGLVVCKILQSQLINWHVANLEIQDRSLYSNDIELFWQS